MLYVQLYQVGLMILDCGDGLIQEKFQWVVAEVGNQDPKRLSFLYLIYAGRCGAIVFREQTFVWFD